MLVAALLCLARFTPPTIVMSGLMALIPFTSLSEIQWRLRVSLADFALGIALLNWLWLVPSPAIPDAPRTHRRFSVLLLAYPGVALFSAGLAVLSHRTTPVVLLEVFKIIILCAYAFFASRVEWLGARRYAIFLPWLIVAAIESLLAFTAVALVPFGYHLPFLYGKRGVGTMVDPNALAGYLSCSLFLMLGLAAELKRPGKGWMIAASLVCGTGLVATASVGGFLGFAAGMLTLSVLACKKDKKLRPVLLAFFIGMVLLIGLAVLSYRPNPVSLALARFSFPDDDPSYRLRLWAKALGLFLSHPILGVGRGGFLYAPAQGVASIPGIPHNTYLGIAAELGLAGLVSFMTLVFYSLRLLLARVTGDEGRSLRYALAAACIALLVQGLTVNIENARVLWLIIGLSMTIPLSGKATVTIGPADLPSQQPLAETAKVEGSRP